MAPVCGMDYVTSSLLGLIHYYYTSQGSRDFMAQFQKFFLHSTSSQLFGLFQQRAKPKFGDVDEHGNACYTLYYHPVIRLGLVVFLLAMSFIPSPSCLLYHVFLRVVHAFNK